MSRALREDGRGLFDVARADRLAERRQRGPCFADEALEHGCGLAPERGLLIVLHPREAGLVAWSDARDEARAKHLLHLGEAAKAQRVGEADDRRGRNARALRDLGDRAQRNVGRVIEHEFGDLLQAAGQRAMPGGDRAAQLVVAHRRIGRFVHGFSRPVAAFWPPWIKHSTLQLYIERSF